MNICCSNCGSSDVQSIEQIIKSGTVFTKGTSAGRFSDGTLVGGRVSTDVNTISRSAVAAELYEEFEGPVTFPIGRGGWLSFILGFGVAIAYWNIVWYFMHPNSGLFKTLAVVLVTSPIVWIVASGIILTLIQGADNLSGKKQNEAAFLLQRTKMLKNGYYCLKCQNKFLPELP